MPKLFRLDVIASVLIGTAVLAAVFVPDKIEALFTPKPKTLLVAVELGSGARRSIATYPAESECLRVEQNLNRIAEENGRTERSMCVAPVDVESSTVPPREASVELH